ncbi:cytochrome P450 [Streptomyces mashuensis]|nr:cytochrome P450 [Streptomyces mashuensis]
MTLATPTRTAAVPVVDVTPSCRSANGATDTPLQQAMDLAREHGPVFRRRQHGNERLFVTSLDLVAELADEDRFAKHVGPALENVREFTADGLFTAYNDEPDWARAHDILLPAFALGSMRAYHPAMLTVARRLIGAWDRHLAEGTPVDVAEDMTRMTLDTIGLTGFGYDFRSFDRGGEPHPFVASMVRCLDWAMTKLGRDPELDHSARDAAFHADAAFLAGVVDEVISARQASGDTRTDDLLGLMLGVPHPSDGRPLSAANIRNQVITFLIAGHETTSGALSFALYYLLKNPVALRLAQREADELWGDVADPEPAFEDIGRLRWTRQVINEALRLWPTAAAFGREAREDTLLGGRYPLRAGEGVTVLTPMLHRDPVWGDNVELFDPTRFAPAAEAARSPHAYKPFGTGERACIGRQFALHEATLLLGLLVHRYRFLDTAAYRLRVKETLTLKPDGFTLSLARRTSADRAASGSAVPGARAAAGRAEDGGAGRDGGLPARVRRGTGLLVLHGSNFGTCRDLARDLADEAGRLGCEAVVAPLDAHTGALPADRPVVVVAASYNGRPTDDAAAFTTWLTEGAAPDAAAGVPYAVLGVGDRNWMATYQRVPTLLDERLAALGGTRLLPRGEADASGDLAGSVEEFTRALVRTLLERYGDPDAQEFTADGTASPESSAYEVVEVTGGPLDALAERHGLLPMTVTEAHDLTAPGHPRIKRFVRVALPGGVTYRTADHLTVLPANDRARAEEAAATLGLDPDAVLSVRPRRAGRDTLPVDRPLTVRDLLTYHLELGQRATGRQRALLAERNPCPPEQAALRAVADDDPRTVLELVAGHPALRGALSAADVLELLPAMRPRHYSISSSPAVSPGHAELMVSVLTAPARSGTGEFRGTGSHHLASLRPGDTVLARVQPCRAAFRIDHRDPAPLVMVAAGTGLAPFRGAVADRAALAASGASLAPALLYFGCDDPDADFLHAAELRAAEEAGVVALRPAFSERPGPAGPFVQHRIAAESDEIWSMLEAGGRVYVCGDGARMAPGVRAALRDLYARRKGGGAAAAEEWLGSLADEGRYVEDVYAGG